MGIILETYDHRYLCGAEY